MVGLQDHASCNLGGSGEGFVGWVLCTFRLGMQLGCAGLEELIAPMEKILDLKREKKEWIEPK